jgi:hypothetical protein
VFGFVAPFHRPNAPAARLHARFLLDGCPFDVVTEDTSLSLRARPDEKPDVTVIGKASAVVTARQERRPLSELTNVVGTRANRHEFGRRFDLRI